MRVGGTKKFETIARHAVMALLYRVCVFAACKWNCGRGVAALHQKSITHMEGPPPEDLFGIMGRVCVRATTLVCARMRRVFFHFSHCSLMNNEWSAALSPMQHSQIREITRVICAVIKATHSRSQQSGFLCRKKAGCCSPRWWRFVVSRKAERVLGVVLEN